MIDNIKHGYGIEYKIALVGILLAVFSSAYLWFTWWIGGALSALIGLISCLIFYFLNPSTLIVSKKNLLVSLPFIFLSIYIGIRSNLNGLLGTLISSLLVVLILLFEDKVKILLLQYYIKLIAIILGFSLLGWVLFLIGINLPFFNVSFQQYELEHYYFFLYKQYSFTIFPRFHSFFLEPGHLGITLSFLLLINRYNLRRIDSWIFLLSILLSFSLSAYILSFVSFFGYSVLTQGKKKILLLTIIVSIFLLFFLFFRNYKDGDNLVRKLIIHRFEMAEEGEVVRSNRNTNSFDNFYDQYIDTKSALWGIGGTRYNEMKFGPNAGYKVFILKFGKIGLVLLSLFYFSLTYSRLTRLSFLLLCIYMLSFFSVESVLTINQLFLFICAIVVFSSKKHLLGTLKY